MEYKDIAECVRDELKIIYHELCKMVEKYDRNYIYSRSLPYKASAKCPRDKKEDVTKLLEKRYYPVFDILLPMIEAGLVERVPDVDRQSTHNRQIVEDGGLERFYSFQLFRYNLNLSCIMQLYLFAEQSIIKFMHQYYRISVNSIFDFIKKLGKDYNFSKEIKEKIGMYKDVINVFKHGYGDSYQNILKKHKSILNDYNNPDGKNNEFIFNLRSISLKELYDALDNILKSIMDK